MSYLRTCSLIVSGQDKALDLSSLRIRFSTRQWDLSTPNIATIRVFNVSPETAQLVQSEYTGVTLQCGYEDGSLGTIFSGELVQVRRGRENATDTYVDLLCTDGIKGYSYTIVSATLAAGSSAHERLALLQSAFAENGVATGPVAATLPDATLPRGKVMFGMARDHVEALADNAGARASIQGGELTIIGDNTVLSGDVEVVSPSTGMVGIPEQTQDGIRVRALINPARKVGGRIQVQGAINEAALNLSSAGLTQNAFLPELNEAGVYRIIVMGHTGDTRGQEWYSDMTCLSLDSTVVPQGLVTRGYSNSDAQTGSLPGST